MRGPAGARLGAAGQTDAPVARRAQLAKLVAVLRDTVFAQEAGLGYLCERDDIEPVRVLQAIVGGRLDKADMLLLARFANATWKASQPFRSLARVTRDNFRPAALLNAEELAKDYVQVTHAAAKLLKAMTR